MTQSKFGELSGQEINSVTPHYENICITTGNDKDGFKSYFISSKTLAKILNEFDFITETKRTSTWVDIDINEWRIEKHNQPRNY